MWLWSAEFEVKSFAAVVVAVVAVAVVAVVDVAGSWTTRAM